MIRSEINFPGTKSAAEHSGGPFKDHPLATHSEPSALYCWILEILYCTPKGRRALLRIPTTEGRSVCLCWAKSKPKGPKGGTHARPASAREIGGSVGLVVAVSSHESATFQGGCGHFCGRVARLATIQGLLIYFIPQGSSSLSTPDSSTSSWSRQLEPLTT